VPSGDPALGRIARVVHAPRHKHGGVKVALFEERDVARWGHEARAWLMQEERRRTIGLVILSVTISIAMSLMATAIVGAVSRRRAVSSGEALPRDVGEPLADVAPTAEEAVGVPVMRTEDAVAEVEPARVVEA
jgi:hypothetical protein